LGDDDFVSSDQKDHHGPHEHHDHLLDAIDLVGAFRFCPCCGNPVLAKDDAGITPAMRIDERTLEALEMIHCSKCYLTWKLCTCGIKR
jgi:hypothetical protein